jgi:periplasmic protein CpxP/Spy
MKKQILSLVALFVLGSAACIAQDQPRGERGQRGNMVEKMKTELSLTDDQAAQMKEVFSQMRPSQQGERPSREEMQKKREEMTAKVKKILTEEQYAKYEKMLKERRPQRPQNNNQ